MAALVVGPQLPLPCRALQPPAAAYYCCLPHAAAACCCVLRVAAACCMLPATADIATRRPLLRSRAVALIACRRSPEKKFAWSPFNI